jgi:hypothetical protein
VQRSEIRRVAFVGDYLPRKCGIATFTHDMHASVAARFPHGECLVVPVNDRSAFNYPQLPLLKLGDASYPSPVRAIRYVRRAIPHGDRYRGWGRARTGRG